MAKSPKPSKPDAVTTLRNATRFRDAATEAGRPDLAAKLDITIRRLRARGVILPPSEIEEPPAE
ncbi:hypothetical protein [Actinoplanes sp. NPDC051851]|uniref:hypothetical protein n=1 Tax=Actinoplanes sp. NPDC051851 TaxID=3154753 RepID=UPI0034445AC5